jgi:hypothetical protein
MTSAKIAHVLNVLRNILVIVLRLVVCTIPWIAAATFEFLHKHSEALLWWLSEVLPATKASEIDKARHAARQQRDAAELWEKRAEMRKNLRKGKSDEEEV